MLVFVITATVTALDGHVVVAGGLIGGVVIAIAAVVAAIAAVVALALLLVAVLSVLV